MNSHEPYDDLHSVLQRSADYLVRRGAEYREQPVTTVHNAMLHHRGSRRLLVGVGAVATLCGAVLVGSFMGGTNGRQVDVAQAAWSAVPVAPTAEQNAQLSALCDEIIHEVFMSLEPAEASTLPEEELKLLLTEMRGSTSVAVYTKWGIVAVCVSFADGSIVANTGIGKYVDELGTSQSFLLNVDDVQYMFVTGLLPVSVSGDTATNVIVKRPGQDDVTASASGNRYAALMPGPDWPKQQQTYSIEYSSEQDGSIREIGPFALGDAPDDVFDFVPETTIVEPPQG